MNREMPKQMRWLIILFCCVVLQSIGRCVIGSATARAATTSPIHSLTAFTTIRAMDQIGPWHKDIYFSGSTPVGGWMNLTIFSNGAYNFSGHLHDSGAPSYNDESVWAVKSGSGAMYVFPHTGRMHGTFESGSRDDDWTKSGTNPAIAADWSILQGHWSYNSNVGVNVNLTSLIKDITTALGMAATVITIV